MLLIIFACGMVSAIYAGRLPDPPVFTAAQHYPSICYLPPDSGLCDNEEIKDNSDELYGNYKSKLLTYYYFDTATEQCYPFGVQNCGGNENRFETLNECQTYCRIQE
uniref:BPTI/Kunitz inhibitor domain-containing protein n=1 Tax=Syphacia muris TaxID=451379 RepID=A0A0N5ATX7_9BILA